MIPVLLVEDRDISEDGFLMSSLNIGITEIHGDKNHIISQFMKVKITQIQIIPHHFIQYLPRPHPIFA